MDTKNLIRFLKNDLLELTDILSDLKPGSSLSDMDLKLIKSRVRSLTEEFEMLESSVDTNATASHVKRITPVQPMDNVEPASFTTEHKPEISKSDAIEVPEEGLTESKPEPEEYPTPNEIVETVEPEVIHLEVDEQALALDDDSVDVAETFSESDRQTQNDATELHEMPPLESNRKQTIAEKYNGASDSLNDRMAAHIVQQDLASKLKQHPIENLNKAIKLNDKVWFIKELFNGNADLYKQTINTINQMADMDEALDFLERNFSFEQGKESFKSFIEFIYRRFLK